MNQPIAFVLTQAHSHPDLKALVEALRRRHPDLAWETTSDSAEPNDGNFPFIRCGRHLLVLMSIDAALPSDDGLWSRAAIVWPGARDIAERHRAHLIVSLMGSNENANELETTRLITAVVGGLVDITPQVCAVVWRSQVARSPQTWLDMSRNAFVPYPDYPFMLWIDIASFRSGQSIGAFTFGLYPFVGREIEFEVPGITGPALVERVSGLACYLIEHRTLVKDGDTIGESETDRIKVHHRTSRFNGAPVLALGPEPSPSGPLKNYPIIAPAAAGDHPMLLMLARVGLFDASSPCNQVQLQPSIYDSEQRLESFDSAVKGWLSKLLAIEAYVKADEKARAALARDDIEMAKSTLRPFAENIGQFQATVRTALMKGKLFLFLPKQSRAA